MLELRVLQVGATGKALTNVVSVGIGGSFLGPLFVHTALQTGKLLGSLVLGSLETSMHFELTCPEKKCRFSDPEAAECAKGRQLRL